MRRITVDGQVFDRLETVLPWVWGHLEAALASRDAAWRTPVLATVSPTGAPRARTIVLRSLDPAEAGLLFYTDQRAAKAADIAASPAVSLLFYDPETRVQLRAEGAARLDPGSATADAAWAALPPAAHALYATALPPGAPHADGPPAPAPDARANFTCLHVTLARLDLLWLGPDRHRRCAFDSGPQGWAGNWLVP
jgi:pyridoxamine 5'-phosphate oxidase